MTSLAALWLPILAAAVIAFLASFVSHMLLPWRRSDYPQLPREEEFRAAVGPMQIPPGDYMVPRTMSMEEMKTEAFRAKIREGPRMVVTVMPTGDLGMGRALVLWFVYLVVVAIFGAYITSRALPPGAEYMRVFQISGATMFASLALGLWHLTIWYHRSTTLAIKDTVDSLVYALLMAGVFGWLWPR
jgi:hypothetical protein